MACNPEVLAMLHAQHRLSPGTRGDYNFSPAGSDPMACAKLIDKSSPAIYIKEERPSDIRI